MATGIVRLDPLVDPRWDAFVDRHPRGTVWHSAAWLGVTQRTYGYRPAHLAYEARGELVGILPLVLVESRLTGRRLVSLPFSGPAGPIGTSPDVVAALTRAALDLGPALGCRYVCLTATEALPDSALATHQPFVSSLVPLAGGGDQWQRRVRPRVRTDVRRAGRMGVSVGVTDRREDLAGFYALYLRTSRRHGMPPQPRALFEAMWQAFGRAGQIELVQAALGGRVIAAQLCLSFKDVLSVVYAGIDYRFIGLGPVKALDWFTLELASARRCGSVDLLLSHVRNVGLRWYKQSFGATEVPVVYHYHPRIGSTSVMREAMVASRSAVPGLIRATVRHLPTPALELLGRLAFPHVG